MNPEEASESRDTDPWAVLQRSVDADTANAAGPAIPELFQNWTKPRPATATGRSSRFKRWALFRVLDALGLVTWAYVALKLFVFDVDRVLLERVSPSLVGLLDYRFLFILVAAATFGLFLWRRWSALFVGYILVFPAVVLFWKLPNLVRRFRLYRSWIFWMLLFQAVIAGVRNFRWLLVVGSLSTFFVLVVVLFEEPRLLVVAGSGLLALLLWVAARVVWTSLRSTWFLKAQQRALDFVGSFTARSVTSWEDDVIAKGPNAILDRTQANSIALTVFLGVFANRMLYLWAYKLQQYHQSSLSLLMSLAAFSLLYVASGLTFGLINSALLKVDPSQFTFQSYPSALSMTLYGFSSLFRAEGGGVAAAGEWAYLLQLVSGIYGWLFLGVVLFSVALTMRASRDQRELRDTVSQLRTRARAQEDELRATLRVGIDEALERFRAMGFGSVQGVYDYFKRNIPEDFLADDDHGTAARVQ